MNYGQAGKASKMMGKGKSKKAAEKPLKKSNQTPATRKKIKDLKARGMSDAMIKRFLDKGAR